MSTFKFMLTVFIASCATVAYSQKIKVRSGDEDQLAQFKKFHIEYYYEDVSVGKFDNEEEYVEKKVTDYNMDEAGKGDQWKKNWYNDREEKYHPKFEELFNKHLEKEEVKAGSEMDAPCTMKVYTTFIEPGFNVGVARKPAYINLEVFFVQDGKELAKITIDKSPGSGAMGYDFDTGFRISEAYAKAGKELAKYMRKKVY